MPKKNSVFARRAWNLLRLALLWARKGGVFKRRFIVDLRLLPKYLKNLRYTNTTRHDSISHYGERELSFDETPIFHFKMNRPASTRFHIPCINYPQVDFDFDFNGNDEEGNCYQEEESRRSFLEDYDSEMVQYEEEEEEGIDVKADQFIAKFYEQIKLQRQVSYLQYNEMLNRGTS